MATMARHPRPSPVPISPVHLTVGKLLVRLHYLFGYKKKILLCHSIRCTLSSSTYYYNLRTVVLNPYNAITPR